MAEKQNSKDSDLARNDRRHIQIIDDLPDAGHVPRGMHEELLFVKTSCPPAQSDHSSIGDDCQAGDGPHTSRPHGFDNRLDQSFVGWSQSCGLDG